jgi:dTDP-4-amino-4,6-dideoxygalactose transaminase
LLDINTETTVAHIFAVRIPNQDTNLVRAEMENYGIQTGLHYFPNHKLSLYRTNYALPATEQLCSELITLPLHNDLSTKDVDYVCGKLLQVVCN